MKKEKKCKGSEVKKSRKAVWLFFLVLFIFFCLPGLAKWYLDTKYPDDPKAVVDRMQVRHGWQIAGAGDTTRESRGR